MWTKITEETIHSVRERRKARRSAKCEDIYITIIAKDGNLIIIFNSES